MKNSKALFQDFVRQLTLEENPEEISAIASLVFEKFLGINRTAIMTGKALLLSAADEKRLNEVINRLNKNEPVQYILGEADFYGRKFQVNSSVLIPRPETELLVREVLDSCKILLKRKEKLRLLDIGTGSGCIPITLTLENPNLEVWATDVSAEALLVASNNAANHQASLQFFQCDILHEEIQLQDIDVIVSNPPYIARQEQENMNVNVLDFEPHLALFVPDNDPLVFYKRIATNFGKNLNPGGLLAFEINEAYGYEVANVVRSQDFSGVEIVRDLSGKERIVKGFKN